MKTALETFERHIFKVTITVLVAIVGWFSSQVYFSLRDIQKQFGEMDKRVSNIEVSRSIYLPNYIKLEGASTEQQKSIDEMKNRMAIVEDTLRRHHIY